MATQGHSKDIVFLSGRRTPFGTFGGTLKDFTATDLGVHRGGSGARSDSGVQPGDIGHVVFGNALQTSADAIYLARHVGLRAGVPIEAPALTVNRLCGSGFQAIVERCAGDPARRGERLPVRRRRDHEPGAARRARRALGRSAPRRGRQVLRGSAVGGADRHVLRPVDGADGGEARRRSTASRARRPTRSRSSRSSARRRRGTRAGSMPRSRRSP